MPNLGVTSIGETCFHLLRERYLTVLAPTGSCVHPLASPILRFLASFQESLQVAIQPLLPMGCSRCYLRKSFPRCLAPNPVGPIECIYLFLPRCHRPSPDPSWVGFPHAPQTRFSVVKFRGWRTFRYVQASEFARLPDRSYRCNSAAGQLRLLLPG